MLKFPYNLRDEYIHGGRFKTFADFVIDRHTATHVLYEMRYVGGGIIFCKTDYLGIVHNVLGGCTTQHNTLITHASGFPINEIRLSAKPTGVRHWFCANKAMNTDELTALPLGLERPDGQGRSWDIRKLERVLKRPREFDNLLYVNHSLTTNPEKRIPPWEWAQDKGFVTTEQNVPFGKFLDRMYRHKFILSPPGTGEDCHRTWEAIYLGCIPIVLRSTLTQSFSDLPILIVDKWSDIDRDMLESVWNDYNNREWPYEKLTISYWEKTIKEAHAKGRR